MNGSADSTAAIRKPIAANLPAPPQTIDELGLPRFMLTDLVLRYAREHGTISLSMLSKALRFSYPVADALFQHFRKQLLVEVKGTVGNDYLFTLTGPARELAAERAQACRYAGPAPVPLNQYAETVRLQRLSLRPSPERLREALSDLVISDKLVDQLGPAMISGRPIFIYGPTGNGKTSIIERFPRIFDDSILVPYAVEADAHIISVFDPLVHHPVDNGSDEGFDPRWIRCKRPCVMTAGELVPSMLEVRLDERSGIYAAPLQMKATNGILLVDDFGRQVMSPRELFNRWILPLDRHVDYLSLQYGFTFQIPFELMLVFATNLKPSEVVDDAFLRRVPNKIYVEPITPETFDEILRRVLQKYGLPFEPSLAAVFRGLCNQHTQSSGLRACYPKDICELILALAEYKRQPFHLDRQALRAATETYFTQSDTPLPLDPSTE